MGAGFATHHATGRFPVNSKKETIMNPNMLGGIVRAIVPPVLSFLIGKGIIPAGDYSTVITAALSLGTAVWSIHTNRIISPKK